MAILLVRIEDPDSIPFNEFYDYNGKCYGISRSRLKQEDACLDPEDFYEGTVDTTCIKEIPVIFLAEDEENLLQILGWYRAADIYTRALRPSLFLEGNLCAASRDALLLPPGHKPPSCVTQAESQVQDACGSRMYEVVEAEDSRYSSLLAMMETYQGANAMLRYPFVKVTLKAGAARNYEVCIDNCRDLAGRLMQNECRDISEVKLLEAYGKQASQLNSREADGFYYLAMASYQLGFVKPAMKAIEKALKLEPEASDLTALKASILVSMGYGKAAVAAFERAYELSGEEDYLLMEGQALLLEGLLSQGYEVFRRITDREILASAGIDPSDLERKWPYLKIRGFHFRDFFRRK